jgi:hypothetical protein
MPSQPLRKRETSDKSVIQRIGDSLSIVNCPLNRSLQQRVCSGFAPDSLFIRHREHNDAYHLMMQKYIIFWKKVHHQKIIAIFVLE